MQVYLCCVFMFSIVLITYESLYEKHPIEAWDKEDFLIWSLLSMLWPLGILWIMYYSWRNK